MLQIVEANFTKICLTIIFPPQRPSNSGPISKTSLQQVTENLNKIWNSTPILDEMEFQELRNSNASSRGLEFQSAHILRRTQNGETLNLLSSYITHK